MTDDAPFGYTKRGTPRKRPARDGEGRKETTDTSEKIRKQIHAMAGYGLDERKIAKVMQMGRETLRKHFRDELERGRDQADAQVVESLFNNCKGGNVTAQIFWLCNRLKDDWQHVQKIEHSGAVSHDHDHRHAHSVADLDKLDTAELARVYHEAAEASESVH